MGSRRTQSRMGTRMSSSVDSETQKLLDAAAKARAEAAELEKALGRRPKPKAQAETASNKSSPPPPPPVKKVAISTAELAARLTTLSMDSPQSTIQALDKLKQEGLTTRWASAQLGEAFPVSQGQLKIQTKIEGKNLNVEDNLDDLKYLLGAVTLGSFLAAVTAGTVVGGNVGATLTYLFAVVPIIFLGIGSTAPGLLTELIGLVKTRSNPEYNERRIRHEAAHFLAGYLCGMPIKEYKASGPTTAVEFYETREGSLAGSGKRLGQEDINKLSVVALAGAVGEVQEFGTSTGSAGDLEQLGRLMMAAEKPMPPNVQQDQSRWAALKAFTLITANKPEYDAVIEAFREKKSIQECIAALETCSGGK